MIREMAILILGTVMGLLIYDWIREKRAMTKPKVEPGPDGTPFPGSGDSGVAWLYTQGSELG